MKYVRFNKLTKGYAYGIGAEAWVPDDEKLEKAIQSGYVTAIMQPVEKKEEQKEIKRGRPKKTYDVHTR